jgi:cation transport ATPase
MEQLERFIGILEGLKMTIVGGIFLLISLYFVLTGTSIPTYMDPAWVTVFICGIPLMYLALRRLINEHWISSALLIVMAMIASIYIGEIFAAGEVTFIMALGALLEDYTVERSKRGLTDLINLKPETGRLIISENGQTIEKQIQATEIQISDV